jgi:hypothetical protein
MVASVLHSARTCGVFVTFYLGVRLLGNAVA